MIIFLNILSNACKYTPEGGYVTLEVREFPGKEESIAVYQTTVTDTGIGMPIIAMTANAFEEDKNRAFEAGMNAHVPKPFDAGKLYAAIHEVLQK